MIVSAVVPYNLRRHLQHIVESTNVYCPHNPAFSDAAFDACNWTGPIVSLKKHIHTNCNFSYLRCSHNCRQSDEVGKLYTVQEFREHRLVCSFRPDELDESDASDDLPSCCTVVKELIAVIVSSLCTNFRNMGALQIHFIN